MEAETKNPIIQVKNVDKIYSSRKGDVVAMQNCNFDVLENEFVSIIGPSGCGKSTLLRMLAGLDFPSSGNILVSGENVIGPGSDRGMVFQSYTLFPWLNVGQNVKFGLELKQMNKEEQEQICTKFLKEVGLLKFKSNYPKELSGGMKQRVAIARALANNPNTLLMDEPFGALDPYTKSSMQLLIRNIWKLENTTIIFVTHDIEEALFLSTKICVMSQRPGTIIDVIDVQLTNNRTLELKDSDEFINLRKKINKIVHPKGLDLVD